MPLLWLSLAFLTGIVLGDLLDWSARLWLALAGLCLALWGMPPLLPRLFPAGEHRLPAFLKSGRLPQMASLPYPLVLMAVTLGAARYQSVQPQITPTHIAWYNDRGETYVLQGMVASQPDERSTYTNLLLEVDRLRPEGEADYTAVEGKLLVRLPQGGDWRYGDRLRLEGELQTPFEDETFSYRAYLSRQAIYSYMYCADWEADCASLLQRDQGNPFLAAIYALRQRALQVVYHSFPDPEASFLAGVLLGVESGIPEDVQQAFRDAGTSHVIVISGFNFAIVAGLFASLFGWLLGRWRGMLVAFAGMALYALLAGAGAVVIRAALMGGLGVFAVQLGRRANGLNSLAFVAAVMALFTPMVLWDVGFQLSVAATLGLVLFAGALTAGFERFISQYLRADIVRRWSKPASEYLLYTLAATLTTLPVILYHFQRASLVSFLANPLVLPAQPAVMVLGGLAVLVGLLLQPLGQAIAYLAWPFAAYTIRMSELMAEIPFASLSVGRISLVGVVVFYVILLGWTLGGDRLRAWLAARTGGQGLRWGYFPGLGLAFLGIVAILVWQAALAAPDGRLHVTVLDVGSGDALLIQTPTGRNLLVDGGPSSNQLSQALGRRLPLFGRRLDYLVVAGAGDEQLAALPRVLERFPASYVWWSGDPAASRSARQVQQRIAEMGIPEIMIEPGAALDLGGGASLQALAVGSRGAVLLLEWGNFRLLLPVGLDFDNLEALLEKRNLGPVTALLLADGGFAPLNPPEWIERWGPQVVLLSVGAGDVHSLPDPETLQALEGYTLLRTDRDGWIELITDGEQIWVEVEGR